MSSKNLFTITINNWNVHNPGKKSTYKKTLISNNLIYDARVCALPTGHKWLYLALLLISGDAASDTVTLSERAVNEHLTARVGAENALLLLQQYQLVTFEKSPLIKERIKEIKKEGRPARSKISTSDAAKELNRNIWDAYKTGYLERYKVEPIRNASVNSKISQLAKRLGPQAVDVVKFYMGLNNQFYSKHMHGIGFCLNDCESLHAQLTSGVTAPTTTSMFAPKKIDWDEFAKELKSKDQQ